MMSPLTSSVSMVALTVVLATPATLTAQTLERASGSTEPAVSRVRPLDAEARKIIGRAVAASPMVARMIAELQATDLIVGVQTCPMPKLVNGDARVVAAAGGVRHVRVRLAVPRASSDLVIVLGHELRHALEIAAAPEITDGESLVRVYRRMGASSLRDGLFETEAALEAGRIVAGELKAAEGR